MATAKITKTAVENLPPPAAGKRVYLWDATLKGFGVMVTDKGSRSYLIQYRMDGRGSPTRRVTIGRHGSPWTAETARSRAAELLEQVRRGVDPYDDAKARLAEKKQALAARAAEAEKNEALAFANIAASYLIFARENLKRWSEQEAIIKRDLLPVFGDTPLPDISADDINDCLAKSGARAKSASLKAYSALRAIFSHAHTNHRKLFPVARSPFGEVVRPKAGGKRSEFLSDCDLAIMWEACGEIGWPFGSIYRLLLLTGLRLREVAEARWSEIDFEGRSWLIPATRMKNGEPHWIPLSAAALEILTELPRDGGCDLIFSTNQKTPVSGFSRAKARLDRAILEVAQRRTLQAGRPARSIKAPDFVIHDLRRTVARGCQRDGVPPEVIERMLGHATHTKSGLKGVYQVFEFENERRDALQRWANRITTSINQ